MLIYMVLYFLTNASPLEKRDTELSLLCGNGCGVTYLWILEFIPPIFIGFYLVPELCQAFMKSTWLHDHQ